MTTYNAKSEDQSGGITAGQINNTIAEASKSKSRKIAIWVAFIGAMGVITAAIISNIF